MVIELERERGKGRRGRERRGGKREIEGAREREQIKGR